jgi:hypothetical protein
MPAERTACHCSAKEAPDYGNPCDRLEEPHEEPDAGKRFGGPPGLDKGLASADPVRRARYPAFFERVLVWRKVAHPISILLIETHGLKNNM